MSDFWQINCKLYGQDGGFVDVSRPPKEISRAEKIERCRDVGRINTFNVPTDVSVSPKPGAKNFEVLQKGEE